MVSLESLTRINGATHGACLIDTRDRKNRADASKVGSSCTRYHLPLGRYPKCRSRAIPIRHTSGEVLIQPVTRRVRVRHRYPLHSI